MPHSDRSGKDLPGRDRTACFLPGDWVRFKSSRTVARVVSICESEATVEIAAGLVRTNPARLEHADPPVTPEPSSTRATRVTLSGPAEDTLDLHGCTVADVEGLVVPFVDRAAVRGLARVTIVHGKGSGRLRKAVHKTLAAHGRVARFSLADSWNGSWGATMAELA